MCINGKYLDGVSYRKNPEERYLTECELKVISEASDGLISICHHGWEHTDASVMTQSEFEDCIQKNVAILSIFPGYAPFWAYTWGRHNPMTDYALMKHSIIPVLIDGIKNYNDKYAIHRELL